MARVTIIGGGVCGGTIARLLSPHVRTTVFEKSGRPSGRVASLLFRDTLIDHGAPCFSLHPETLAFLSELLREDLLPIPGKFLNVSEDSTETADDRPLMYLNPSANTLGLRLLAGLPGVTVKTNALVARDAHTGVLSASGSPLPPADATVVTAPLPQAAALYPDLLDADSVAASFAPSLMTVAAFAAGTPASDGVYARSWADGASATRESLKARGAREDIFVVRGPDAFSRLRLDEPPADWSGDLVALLARRWPGLARASPLATFAKRWRYAEAADGFRPPAGDAPFLRRGSVFFAGDALAARAGRRGVDAAFVSAVETAAAVGRSLAL